MEVYLSLEQQVCQTAFVLMPFGRIGFVEVKTPGEKPRSLQRLRIKALRRLGFKAFVLDSPDQIGGIIDEIQTP